MAARRFIYGAVALAAYRLVQAEIGVSDSRVQSVPEWLKTDERRLKRECTPPGEDFKCKYMGRLLPLFGTSELEWPNVLRLFLYMLGLGYTFLGIAIISDIFMSAIEKVTSLKKRVTDKASGRTMTVYVWNDTVANLTLMALGSSAPEILLSLIEITSDEMFLGDLGAGTIVGSAAFNLLVISAVCVMAMPAGEVRYIKQTTVYAVTATWSVLAYMWLMFVVMVTSPNVCEAWEAVVTLLFCPLLVIMAYGADRGYFSLFGEAKEQEHESLDQTIPDDVTQDEIAMIEQQIREIHGSDLTPEQVVQLMCNKYFTKRSRAYYRNLAIQKTIGGQAGRQSARSSKFSFLSADLMVTKPMDTQDSLAREKRESARINAVAIGFESARYAFLENCGTATVFVTRSGPKECTVSVDYSTRDGTATSIDDYKAISGTVIFAPGEVRKSIEIKVLDDNAYEENEEFYIDLADPVLQDAAEVPECSCNLAAISSVIVVIIDDDLPGIIKWQKEEVEVREEVEGSMAEIIVERHGGASGTISCRYNTEDMNAVAGMDYEETSGKLELGPNIQNAIVQVPIKPKGRYDKTSSFIVRLTEPVGCIFDKETDGGDECCICHVTIKGNNSETRMNVLKRMESRINTQQARLGHKRWRQQFYDAIFQVVEDDDGDGDEDGDGAEEDNGPTKFDYFMHFVSVPWKVLFAFVPPVDYCGGWVCFISALVAIAVVTAFVGDLANLVGCCLDIDPEITAITFVALGTSLPDTFASKTAAIMDPYADASIGNITGSNSVNVFIGLGLSWTMAAIYWEAGEPTDNWKSRVFDPAGPYYDIREDVVKIMKGTNGVFVVPRGTLWFNLMVFSCNALFAIQHLFARRKKWGGELGGPLKGFMGQYFSGAFLIFQWVIYVGASSAWATSQNSVDCP